MVRSCLSCDKEDFHGCPAAAAGSEDPRRSHGDYQKFPRSRVGLPSSAGAWGFLADTGGYETGRRALVELAHLQRLGDFSRNLQDVQGAGAAPWRSSALEKVGGPKSHDFGYMNGILLPPRFA